MQKVIFDPVEFRELYPEFKSLSDVQLNWYFARAEMLLDNGNCSQVSNLDERKILLYLLTAHIAILSGGANGQKPQQSVGRVSNATQGSVSVGFTMEGVNYQSSWYMQTIYGAEYWTMTAKYRVGHLVQAELPSRYPRHYYRKWGRNVL